MANIAYFEIPANNVDRAKHFYHTLLGWKIEPIKNPIPNAAMLQYHEITTGAATEGTMNSGGIYKRQMNEDIRNYVLADDFDGILAKVEKLGGRIVMPKTDIPNVGLIAIIMDTEGNAIGIWKPGMK